MHNKNSDGAAQKSADAPKCLLIVFVHFLATRSINLPGSFDDSARLYLSFGIYWASPFVVSTKENRKNKQISLRTCLGQDSHFLYGYVEPQTGQKQAGLSLSVVYGVMEFWVLQQFRLMCHVYVEEKWSRTLSHNIFGSILSPENFEIRGRIFSSVDLKENNFKIAKDVVLKLLVNSLLFL